MFCEKCKKAEATIHLTEIIKDIKSELHLCEKCAREIGLNSKLSNFSLSIPEMLSFLDINEVDENVKGNVCKTCGLSFIDYRQDGKLGCPDCYIYMKDALRSIIAGYHSEDKHIGKHPDNLESPQEPVDSKVCNFDEKSILDLKNQLEEAIFEERYEEAAVLRDMIRKSVTVHG